MEDRNDDCTKEEAYKGMRHPFLPPLFNVFQAPMDEIHDMLIVQGVKDHPAYPPVLYQPESPQEAEMMGNSGNTKAQDTGDVTYTKLLLGKDKQNLCPGLVSEDLEDLREPVHYPYLSL